MESNAVEQAHVPSVFEDPQTEVVARVYAQSLINLIPADRLQDVLEQWQAIASEVLPAHPQLRRILSSGMIDQDKKRQLLEKVLQGRVDQLLLNMLGVMARNGRLDLIEPVAKEAWKIFETKSGRQRVQVVSATPLTDGDLQAVRESIGRLVSGDPILEPRVDPSLLGGLQIRIDDTLYDGSLRSRLDQLRHQLRQRSMHEIQSGRDRFRS